uniref:Uncharacterized protein n=1 Tax=Mesocestoides corti TaxID=53468 RepID=A0A5K3FIT3_MESCO
MKKTATTERALLTNHKPETQVRRRPPESITLATPLIIYCSSFAIGSQRNRGLAEASVVQNVCALRRRCCTFPTHGMVMNRESKTKGSTLTKAVTSNNLITNRPGLRGKTGSLYILVLIVSFSPWSVPWRYNKDGKLVRGWALSPRSVIQCPRDATHPEVAPPVT